MHRDTRTHIAEQESHSVPIGLHERVAYVTLIKPVKIRVSVSASELALLEPLKHK